MPLQRQNIPISFAKGVDTKSDPKQVVPGQMLELFNGTFDITQEINKIPGNSQIGTSVTTGNAIAAYNEELDVFNGSALLSYSETQNQFNSKGVKIAADLSSQAIVRNIYQQTAPDFAYHSNSFSVSAWEDSSGGVRYAVFDNDTNQSIVPNGLVSVTGSKPKVLALGVYVIILFIDNATTSPVLKYCAINSATLSTIGSAVTLQSMTAGSLLYDATKISTSVFVAAQSSSTVFQVFSLSPTLVQSSSLSKTLTVNNLCLFGDSSFNVWLGYSTTTGLNTTVSTQVYNNALAVQVLAPTVVEVLTGDTAPEIANITGISPATTARFFYEIVNPSGNTYDEYIRTNTVTLLGVVGTPRDLLRSVGLASKPFVENSVIYVAVVHDSSLQQTYFVCDSSSNLIAKIAQGNGGGLITTHLLPEVSSPLALVHEFPFLQKDTLNSVNGDVFSQYGVSLAILIFREPLVTAVLGNNLHSTGGVLSMYDGSGVVEHNYHVYPENLETALTYATGGLSQGVYQYTAVWEWTDNQGQLHQSAPSVPVEVRNTADELTFLGDTSTVPQGTLALGRIQKIIFPSSPVGNTTEIIWPQILVSGMKLTSAGNLTDPTYVYETGTYLYNGPVYPGTNAYESILTDIPAAATTAGAAIVATPNLNFDVSTTVGSNKVRVTSQEVYGNWIFDCVKGSSDFYCYNTTGLKIGMAVHNSLSTSNPLFGMVSAINGNIVNFIYDLGAGPIPVVCPTSANGWAASMDFLITGTYTPASATATGVELGFTGSGISPDDGLYVGQIVYDSGNVTFTTSPCAVVSFTSTTVTFSSTVASVGASSPKTAFGYSGWSAEKLMSGQRMQTEDNTTIVPGTFIDSVTLPASTSSDIPYIIIDGEATATQSNINAFTSDVAAARVQIPTLRLTAKTSNNSNSPVVIAIYRTVANGTTFYKVSSITDPLINDPTVDSLAFRDVLPDNEIIGNQQLYTTGGELENIAMPATNILAFYKNRLIAVPSESPNSWWYSKQVVPGVPVEFSDLFVQNVDSRGGFLTALGVMDDKLIQFKRNSVFYTVGSGPSPNGTNNDFSESVLIASDVGCINKKSVVTTQLGIIFQSGNGIYLLDRALQTAFIGVAIESFTANSLVTSAHLIPGVTQVRFTMDSGVELIFDYFVQEWTVRQNVNASDSVIFDNKFTYVTPAGVINQQTSAFDDNGAVIPISLKTSWLSFAGLQSFQRAYKLILLGEYKSPHTLTIGVAYDFDPTVTQTTVIPVLTSPGTYQYKVLLQRQKCEAIQLTITETQPGPTYGEGLSLSAMAFEVGAKVGTNKVKTTNVYD